MTKPDDRRHHVEVEGAKPACCVASFIFVDVKGLTGRRAALLSAVGFTLACPAQATCLRNKGAGSARSINERSSPNWGARWWAFFSWLAICLTVPFDGVNPYILDSSLTCGLDSSKPLAPCRAKCDYSIPVSCTM